MATTPAKARDRARYDLLLFSRVFTYPRWPDPTITHCPIVSCQRPVSAPPLAEDGRPSEWDRLRMCECGFAFCMCCRHTWHGPHTTCSFIPAAEFAEKYLQFPEGSPQRLSIERRHGRANVLKVVAKFQEEQLNQKWMESETTMCAHLLYSPVYPTFD